MIGRLDASAMRLKCSTAMAGDWPRVNGAGGNTSSAEAPPASAMRASRAASRLPSAQIPLTIGSRLPISSCAMSRTRRCSSKLQDATSVEWALMVMAERPSIGRHVAQMLAEALFVDRKVVEERQQDRRNDAMRHIVGVTGHFGSPWPSPTRLKGHPGFVASAPLPPPAGRGESRKHEPKQSFPWG